MLVADYDHTDARTNFNATVFRVEAVELDVLVGIALTWVHDCIVQVERSHVYIETVCDKLWVELPLIR